LPGQDLDAWLTRRKVASTTVSAASGAPEQANQLQDLVTATKIDALVILPFESAALTRPVQQVKAKGVYVTALPLRRPCRGRCHR